MSGDRGRGASVLFAEGSSEDTSLIFAAMAGIRGLPFPVYGYKGAPLFVT